ncbi:glycoside hydrolase family 15 protein [Neobacillus drentensis]|uniref:glycoside hydrolase family 15 protein n=1 Tax=Neobacillus drentensis TaxID=220684 RepID=UPI002FFF15C8
MMNERIFHSYQILDQLRLPHGLYLASSSKDYHYVWLRDSFYMSLPYLEKNNQIYEMTYHRILDLFREYEWKLDIHTVQRPREQWEYIHARYSASEVREIDTPWGHAQHDAIGAILWGIGMGHKRGKTIIRDDKDHEIVQKLVGYLGCVQYWEDADNGMWEEWREIHSSSVGACVAGLQAVKDIVFVPGEWITKGRQTLTNLYPHESSDRPFDLAQLSLIFPYGVSMGEEARVVVDQIESHLLRERGVIRYKGDSYYSTVEHEGRHHDFPFYYGTEAEWTFGLPWLALCHLELGNVEKANHFIKLTEKVMLSDGSLPELYFAGTDSYNSNTPLGWGSAMYILAIERYERIV